MAEGVSVIICCYNSESRIEETISYVANQKVPSHINWELVVVNNASTDNTSLIASQSWINRMPNASLKIVDEPNPGLASARLKGIAVAQFDVLIFCDDDNHFDPNYVFRANHLMHANPRVGVIGGWVKPKLPFYPGKWIEDFYSALAIGKQVEKDDTVEWVFGAGMILRKEIFNTLKKQKIDLLLTDRVDTKQTSGGDAEICLAARFIGYTIFYSNSLMLEHKIAAHRLTKKSFIKGNYRNVFPLVYLYLMEKLMKDKGESISKLYRHFFLARISLIIHFLPRCFVGRHQFYSFIMLYQNVQLFFWLLTRKKKFRSTAITIRNNLYHDREYC
jgi:glycosyltransferase involved in cell wall biosynthesis